ncbi:hypothetical protein CN074_25055 [Sinorhizobium medicae]|uniref:hypothetical protein n=1 Tax=Sinorhizobium medicae TaxID=110321 RepID=UPI000FD8F6BA|nr:hypothetical protein [Sinorhizobium medicae]RVH83237.1 hypothetical protein CN201_28230 [Sinorhizobium medicae]RVP63866.1 hypothetical protein CN074_25055 [Sinorhizobium medicae]
MIRYITPRREYQKRLKIYRRCPEIRHLLREQDRQFWKAVAIGIPVALVLGIPFLIVSIGQWLEGVLERIRLPHWAIVRSHRDIVREAHAILPPHVIRARIED